MVRYDAEKLIDPVEGDNETPRGSAREAQLPPGWVALTTAEGRGQDTCVRQGNSGAPYGNSPLLMVKNSSAFEGNRRKAWLAFDLDVTGRRVVAEAELVLSIEPSGLGYASMVPDATFRLYGLKDETVDATWDGASLRWEDAPANVLDDGIALDPEKVVPLGEFVVEQGVSSGQRIVKREALAEFLRSDTNGIASFVLVRLTDETDRHGLVHAFASREHPVAMPPTLRLRFAER
ncbi:MAG: DNRLRE domain-containing protein, partial [Verrucomicrobiae bacterium]|nr:DNRLRE domain-containing protein [Verrucomicrobiae bacterium]